MATDSAGRIRRGSPTPFGPHRALGNGATPPAGQRHLVDGRVARGELTRRGLIEALVTLVDDGAEMPTSMQAADLAGVSVRLVFHHFRGMDGLLLAAVSMQSERHRDILFAIPSRGSSTLRIQALVRQRRLYFERIGPVYRAAYARPQPAAGLGDVLAHDRTLLRVQLSSTLGPEIDTGRGPDDELLDALEQTTGWEAWRSLRDIRHLSAPSAERAMAFAAGRLVG